MRSSDVRIGLRVRRIAGATAFLPDSGRHRPRRIGVIASLPERIEGTTLRQVLVSWEGDNSPGMSEYIQVHRLEAIPDQPDPPEPYPSP